MRFDIKEEHYHSKQKNKKYNKLYLILLFSSIFVLLILSITYLILSSGTHKRTMVPIKTIEKSKLKVYDETSNERPIAVMIDNNIGDANHAGLQESYLNYEIIVEGGLTRIMALYKDKNTKLIGPVRSARHYFLDYAIENDAIYAHYGWSPKAQEDISSLSIDNINGITDSKPFRRDDNLKAPHNVFTNISYIKEYISKKKYSKTSSNWKLLSFSEKKVNLDDDNQSNISNKINIVYSSNEYRSYAYDESNGYYLRSQNGKAHIDRNTNEQLHYKNIIIIKVKNVNLDSQGRQDLINTGNGKGYYITNGKYKAINWSKSTRASKTHFTYEDGTEVKLNDGNTFIQIVPIDNEIIIN